MAHQRAVHDRDPPHRFADHRERPRPVPCPHPGEPVRRVAQRGEGPFERVDLDRRVEGVLAIPGHPAAGGAEPGVLAARHERNTALLTVAGVSHPAHVTRNAGPARQLGRPFRASKRQECLRFRSAGGQLRFLRWARGAQRVNGDCDVPTKEGRTVREIVVIWYRGAAYQLGRGRDFYGIWPAGVPKGQPRERWPLTTEGWYAAWARFAAIEAPGTIAPAQGPPRRPSEVRSPTSAVRPRHPARCGRRPAWRCRLRARRSAQSPAQGAGPDAAGRLGRTVPASYGAAPRGSPGGVPWRSWWPWSWWSRLERFCPR